MSMDTYQCKKCVKAQCIENGLERYIISLLVFLRRGQTVEWKESINGSSLFTPRLKICCVCVLVSRV